MKKTVTSILFAVYLCISLSSCDTTSAPTIETDLLPVGEDQLEATQELKAIPPPPESGQAPFEIPQPVPGPIRECIEAAVGAGAWHEIDAGQRLPTEQEDTAITACIEQEIDHYPEPPSGEPQGQPMEEPISIGSPDDMLALFPEMPLPVGELITAENAFIQVNYYDRYAFYDDYQMGLIPVHVTDLAGRDNEFSIALVSEVSDGWLQPGPEGPTHPIPGEAGGDLLMALPPFRASQTQEDRFTFEVRSPQYQESLSFSFTVVAYPQLNATQGGGNTGPAAMIVGLVTDAVTGQPIYDAEVSMWLGPTTRVMPFDMLNVTQDDGSYAQSVWDIDIVNSHYAPYTEVPGYVLMVQKEGYHTYIHDIYVRPRYQTPATVDVSLIPLDEPAAFDLKWETPLWSPGVWEIEMNDTWDRFAVAMGKHPDDGDPETLPTQMSFLDATGSIIWSNPLPDQTWAVAVSGDGSLVAGATHATRANNYVYVWDDQGNELWKRTLASEAYDISISPDNQHVAVGPPDQQTSLGLFDARSGAQKWTLDTDFKSVRQVDFTPDGQYILTGPLLHMVALNGEIVWRRYEFSGLPYVIWTSPDMSRVMIPDKGDYISMYNGNGDLLWRRELRVLTYGAMSADGSLVVALAHNGNLFAYNGAGELLWYRKIPVGDSAGGAGHNGIDITPDGRYIAVGGGNYTTLLYDAQGNLLWRHQGTAAIDQTEHPYLHSVMAVRISPDGTKLVSGYGTSDPRICYFEKSPSQ